MRRALVLLSVAFLLTSAASAPVQGPGESVDAELRRARAEAAAADLQVQKLNLAASKDLNTAARLRTQQLAAAEAIGAAEARITAYAAETRLIAARQALLDYRLRKEQQPLASLLAGLAMMAQRPPVLALADHGSTDDMVRVRVLLDSTLPLIRARTAGLSRQLAEGTELQKAAVAAQARLRSSRIELGQRRQEFAALEQRALQSAARTSGQALTLGDVALAATETVDTLSDAAQQSRSANAILASLLRSPEPQPGPSAQPPAHPPIAYVLPADAPIRTGLGAVSASGVRSRGLSFATWRGAAIRVPADGIVRFAGPFRDFDGVIIIDHGRGWTSLLVNVTTTRRVGDRVRRGQALGRALGPIDVELSHRGRHVSPAIIAGSSSGLSKIDG